LVYVKEINEFPHIVVLISGF